MSPEDSTTPENVTPNPDPATSNGLETLLVPPAPLPLDEPLLPPTALPQSTASPFRVTGGPGMPRRQLMLLISAGSIGCLLVIALLFFVLTAYGKLKIGSYQFRTQVAMVVQGLPFMPKNAGYVSTKMLIEQASVKKYVMDVSAAISSKSLVPLSANGTLEMHVTGPIDLTDIKKPEMALHVNLTKQIDGDITFKNNIVYFRLTSFPSLLGVAMSSMGLPESIQQQFVQQWFYYDTSPLDTEASKDLEKQNSTKQKTIDKIASDEIATAIEKYQDKVHLKMTSERIDGHDTYKISMVLPKEVIDAMEKSAYIQSDTESKQFKPTISTMIPSMNFTYWVEKKVYLMRKLSINFVVKQPKSAGKLTMSYPRESFGPAVLGAKTALLAQTIDTLPFFPQPEQDMPVSFVMKFDKINEAQSINAPVGAIQFEQFLQTLVESQMGSDSAILQPRKVVNESNNTVRKVDVNAILNAIHQYASDNNGVLPLGITSMKKTISKEGADICAALVPTYIAGLPVDPNINTGLPITQQNCSMPYYTGYSVQTSGNKVTVSAQYAEQGEQISVTR